MHSFNWKAPWHANATIVVALLFLAAGGQMFPALDKFGKDKQLGIKDQIPASMGGWSRVNPTTPIEKNNVNYNEIYQALYTHPEFGRMAVTIEYTSDSRRQFELHYPNICHEIRGDQVIEFPSRNLTLPDGRSVEAAIMSWQQPHDGNDALTAYWYVTRQGVTTDTVKLKWDQALSGLLRRPSEAVMVRFDSFYRSVLPGLQRESRMKAVDDLVSQLNHALKPDLSRQLFIQLDEV
jgi:EpsI family protein